MGSKGKRCLVPQRGIRVVKRNYLLTCIDFPNRLCGNIQPIVTHPIDARCIVLPVEEDYYFQQNDYEAYRPWYGVFMGSAHGIGVWGGVVISRWGGGPVGASVEWWRQGRGGVVVYECRGGG